MTETITIELEKDDVIRMVCGSAIPTGGIPLVVKAHGPHGSKRLAWDREELAKLTLNELMQLYATLNWSQEQPDIAPRILLPQCVQP